MAFSVSTLKGVKVYNLTFGKTAEQWKEEQRSGSIHSLRYTEAYRRRVEFVQDASFPTASLKVQMSDDGMYMMATGLYPPRMKMFDLSELSMKFERFLESEAIDFCMLTPDWEKFVILREFRWMEFHSRHGRHYNMRLPLIGTSMVYNKPMCELYIATSKNVVLRANLEQGRYYAPYRTDLDLIQCCDTDKTHLLTAFGDSLGVVECWDPRVKKSIARLDMYESIPSVVPTPDVSKLKFGNDGLTLAVGLGSGHVAVYDLRRHTPLHLLNHRNKQPVKDIAFHQQSSKIISCDSRTIRYWEQSTGELYTVITPSEPVNGLAVVQNSGILFVAQEQHRIGAYYVPSVGMAPKWCPFLDNMTEELEESKYKSIYIDYKFVSRDELEALGLEHLIGSNILKPYMHGYFMDIKLYRRVRAIVDPDAYDQFLKTKTAEKMEEQRSGRIKVKRKLPAVNKSYANYLLNQSAQQKKQQQQQQLAANGKGKGKGKKGDGGSEAVISGQGVLDLNPLMDPRFGQMFKDRDFTIDFAGDKYLHLHPEIHYAMDQKAYYQMVKEQKEREERGEDVDRDRDGDSKDKDGDDDDDDAKEVDDDDILVTNRETYDDKYLRAKEYMSTMDEDYSMETQLHTLIDKSDDEKSESMEFAEEHTFLEDDDDVVVDDGDDDGWDEGMREIQKLRRLDDVDLEDDDLDLDLDDEDS